MQMLPYLLYLEYITEYINSMRARAVAGLCGLMDCAYIIKAHCVTRAMTLRSSYRGDKRKNVIAKQDWSSQ
jgi:hypothetical protein